MTTARERTLTLLKKLTGSKHLPLETWVEDNLAANSATTSLGQVTKALQLRRAYPELDYSDATFLALWSVFEEHAMHSNDLRPSKENFLFLHFLLGLRKLVRKGKSFNASHAMMAIEEGEQLEKDLLAA